MTDATFNAQAPAGHRIMPESEGARIVERQTVEDRLHPLFRKLLKPFCAGIAERMVKENEKGEMKI